MHRASTVPTRRSPVLLLALLLWFAAACGGGSAGQSATAPPASAPPDAAGGTLTVSAIPDQDPQELQRLYDLVADHLERAVGVPVEYVPVTDYNAAVRLFRSGDLDLVWFGGLTGVQARLQTPGPRCSRSVTSTRSSTACSSSTTPPGWTRSTTSTG